MKKRGQFRIGFGMIFSIILIVSFIVVAFVAINASIKLGCSAQQGIFLKNLQNEIDRIWSGAGAEITFKEKIPGCDITHVCFWDTEFESSGEFIEFTNDFIVIDSEDGTNNFYFYKREDADIPSTLINHIKIEESKKNPACYGKNLEGEFKIPLKKNLDESLVRVS